jgi:hypothetical protein
MQTRQPTARPAAAETALPVALVCGPAVRSFRQAAARACRGSQIGIVTAAASDRDHEQQSLVEQMTLYPVGSTDPEGANGPSELLGGIAAIAADHAVDGV